VTAGAHLFQNFDVTEVYGKEATRERILSELSGRKTKPQDVFIFYLSGQIRNDGEGWTFLPHAVSPPGKGENVRKDALSPEEISEAIRNVSALQESYLHRRL